MAIGNPFLTGLDPFHPPLAHVDKLDCSSGYSLSPVFTGRNRYWPQKWVELLQPSGGQPNDVKHSESGEFFLQQFRRPKRIRTAFSHSQLLQLEEAFDHNNYLVGPERKLLAQKLELSETQIKVWFQNRRTKRRRLLSEEASRISSTFETLVDK